MFPPVDRIRSRMSRVRVRSTHAGSVEIQARIRLTCICKTQRRVAAARVAARVEKNLVPQPFFCFLAMPSPLDFRVPQS